MSIFIGLDLSLTASGVCILGDENGTPSVVMGKEIKTKPDQFPHLLARCDYISDEVMKIVKGVNSDFIIMEDFFTGQQPGTVISLACVGTLVRYKLMKSGYNFFTVAPTQLKKFVTGKGVGRKDVMIKYVFQRFGYDTNSNNVCDACGLAYFGRAIWHKMNERDIKLLAYEDEMVKKVIKERQLYTP